MSYYCLSRNILWAIAIGINAGENHNCIGSWTDFNKQINKFQHQSKSILEYLPVIPKPLEYLVCKKFLDNLLELYDILNINHIFAHSDEQVYAQLYHIIWKEPQVYQKIVVLMGGFHQLRVRQKLIYKRHHMIGY